MKNLDEVVLDALELHGSYDLPELELAASRKRLVVASGNALPTAKIVFDGQPCVFCDEGGYEKVLEQDKELDSAAVVSASGGKHAPIIVDALKRRGLDTYLVTCNGDSAAAAKLEPDHVFVTKSIEEPITYNTSTYMGMMLLKTREQTQQIREHLLTNVDPLIGDMTDYQAFYIVVEPRFDVIREMFITKFDELFGGKVNGRCYTSEQTFHAKTVVPWDQELFIGLGYDNQQFGQQRLNVPLPAGAQFVAAMATGYYVVGKIQKQFPPWFAENAEPYREIQQGWFNAMGD